MKIIVIFYHLELRSREEKSQQFFNSTYLAKSNDNAFDSLQEESFNQVS